jgi:IS66 Orf2 like protein
MIGPSGAVRVMLATRPVAFRKGMDGLAALVRDAIGADPFSGTVYVFRSKWTCSGKDTAGELLRARGLSHEASECRASGSASGCRRSRRQGGRD